MPSQKPGKVVIDTNLWISFLIGKELQGLKDLILNDKIKSISKNSILTFSNWRRTKVEVEKEWFLEMPLN